MRKRPEQQIEVVNGLDCVIPPKPPDKEIAGFDLPKEKQKWTRTELPEIFKSLPKSLTGNDILEHLTKEHWAFMDQEWDRRIYGCWFFNNGVPTYITGAHYMYINYWKPEGEYLDYRDVDRKKFLFWKACEEDPNCMGMIEIARRRLGKSAFSGFNLYEYISRTANAYGGIQSKTNLDSTQFFQKHVISAWRKLPFFFCPVFDSTTNPRKDIRFFAPARKGKRVAESIGDAELESWIDSRPCLVESYDGEKLHRYIGDEEGKTVEIDVAARWRTVKFCLLLNGKIIGKSIHTSTVEEMEKWGGKNYYKIWEGSDHIHGQRFNGRTKSGLYKYFIPAYKGYKIDEYGNDLEEESLAEIMAEREAAKDDPKELASLKRKNPLTEKEAFLPDGTKCLFDAIKIQARIDQVQGMVRKPYLYGNLEWENNIKNDPVNGIQSRVIWYPCTHFDHSQETKECTHCRFKVAHLPPPGFENGVEYIMGQPSPKNGGLYIGSADPYDHNSVVDEKKASKGAIRIIRKFDPLVDTEETPWWEHKTMCSVVQYNFRPPDRYELFEDVIKVIHFYGCQMFPETDKPGLKYYIQERGYANFLLIRPKGVYKQDDLVVAKTVSEGGSASRDGMVDAYVSEIEYYVNHHIHKEPFEETLEQLLEFDYDKRTRFDQVVSLGFGLVACRKRYDKDRLKIPSDIQFFKRYDRNGNVIVKQPTG